MKKVTAFLGTSTRKATYKAVQEFERNLKRHEDIDFEYIFLSDYRLEFCRGCKACFSKGEEYCPSKDDRDVLLRKIEDSDGVIFATPTYAGQVTARMKNFIDRMSFIFHRPRYFDKAFTAIVTQGLPIGSDTLKYMTIAGRGLGFHVSRGCCLTTLDPMTTKQQREMTRRTREASDRFHAELHRPLAPPSFFWLMAFRFSRAGIRTLGPQAKDYQYYEQRGWFESDYYYPTKLGPVKRMAGHIFDLMGKRVFGRL